MNYTNALMYLFVGLGIITLIDTLGAIASRKLNFKYSSLIVLSTALYIYIGYLTSAQYGLLMSLLINGILGLYDGTIGLKLSILLKANTGLDAEKTAEITKGKAALVMINIAFVFAVIGFVITKV